ncbi:MAG TPA: alpha/beta hydrolase [Acidimicrobiales bacterium]|nr:alpha/beta hydrolase [Acidimicrobiales bacterium]
MARAWEKLLVADRGHGPPVLLVHGQPGGAEDWDRLCRSLGDGQRLLVVDRPGYGNSGLEARSMADNAELLADLLADLTADGGAVPAVVVGHSYGGGIALLMAARRPEVVAGVVLLAAVGAKNSVNGFDHLLAAPVLGEALSAAGLFTLGRLLPPFRQLSSRLPAPFGAWLEVSLPDGRYAAELNHQGMRLWRTFLTEQRSLLASLGDLELSMGRVRVPAIVASGTRDVVVPPRASAVLAAGIRGAELVSLAGVGHFVARDAPDRVARLVRRVLQRAWPS